MNTRQNMLSRNWGTYVFLLIMSIIVLFPLIITFSQSLMTNQQVNRWPPPLLPVTPTLDAYNTVFSQPDLKLVLWLGNSIYAATCYTLAVLAICTPAAYAFSRLKFPGRNILFSILLITVMIPSQVTLIPNFILMKDLKFLDTFNALIWPGAANVFGVFLLRQFMQQIPLELEEAAILDGATYWGRFRYVILPLSTNAITALAILVFLGHYNDLLWPFITMNSLEKRTLPVGLQILNSAYAGSYRPIVLAGSIFATVPIIVFYIIFQRRIIKGVTLTGMGGR
ncbi:MAG: carbohydrate ABC transporter permease [Chloroflexi bacterium]|nr:carbohydrate ABC transporter permease [Chloroflexota bacterium]MCC6897221.1 carbohydrate ABC transporter permease [Anaerolineae bacterium]